MALTLDEEKAVEGEIGLDTLVLAPTFALAIGAAGHDAAEPLGAGLVKGWRGRIAFQALRGVLPGGAELQQVGGTVKADGQSLGFDDIKGKIGGGEISANIDARPGANGISLNARVQLSGVDGDALRYRACDARRPRLAANDAGKPGPQCLGADRCIVRQRHRDIGSLQNSRGSIRAPSRPRFAPATTGRPRTTPG